jgi:hypothetical protein
LALRPSTYNAQRAPPRSMACAPRSRTFRIKRGRREQLGQGPYTQKLGAISAEPPLVV